MQSTPQQQQEDDPFADLCADIDRANNQLVTPAEFGSGVIHKETKTTVQETTEATEHTISVTDEDDDEAVEVRESNKQSKNSDKSPSSATQSNTSS